MPVLRQTAPHAALLAALILATSEPGHAEPRTDLSQRISIDGFTGDFAEDEYVFGVNDSFLIAGVPCVADTMLECPLEEGLSDSEWGFFNDVNQIHVTWDASFLYVGVDAITWNNNLMLYLDTTRRNGGTTDRGRGLPSLLNVNAWRRNISFGNGFEPDLFLATWDTNKTPQVWRYLSPRTVNQLPASAFTTLATFSGSAEGNAMEAAIPWSLILQSDSTLVSAAYGGTVPLIPVGFDTLRLAACITAGGDGTGSPDSAPDNFSGHQVDGNAPAFIDNFAIIPLDLLGPTPDSAPDRVPDFPGAGQTFAIPVHERVSFVKRPPVRGIGFSLEGVAIQRGVVSPEEGYQLEFSIDVTPDLPPDLAEGRSVALSAEIYDMRGERRRVLYRDRRIGVSEVQLDTPLNRWDGRDDAGRIVEGGMYILRVVLEPAQGKVQRSFAVIR